MIVSTNVGGGAQPQLYAPTISISGRTLTITPNSNNGTFGDNFVLYDGADVVVTVPKSTTTINLDTYFSTAGSHSLSVKMTGTKFEDSNASNALSYGLYTISVSITDGSAVYDNMINNLETKVISLTADEGYILPASVTVSGATSSYNSSAGTITISNATENVTVSVVCEEEPEFTDLNSATWQQIKGISDNGQGANYFDIGDRKAVTLNGTVGTLALNNVTEYVYIIGFDHNSAVEGTGISFGTFFTALENGTDVALCDSHYNSSSTDGSKWFNMNHSSNTNDGGWQGCDLRYDILGSVEAKNQQNATSAAITSPVVNTLMAALPSELRDALKPVTKYTDNVGGATDIAANVTSTVDYLFLLAEKEIFGSTPNANTNEGSHQSQYSYYASASKIKYNHSSTASAIRWCERSPANSYYANFCQVYSYGTSYTGQAEYSFGLAPAFVV